MKVNNHEFINSKGVFQGGGCKAVAFIGAYEAALENGVCFTEFAGTSAGSIFAALMHYEFKSIRGECYYINFVR